MVPLHELRDGLHVSISQVKGYLRCPKQYELRYVRGLKPAFVPVPLVFGIGIHAALSQYYEGLRTSSTPPALAELVAVFQHRWSEGQEGPVPIQPEHDDKGVDHIQRGTAMLAAFHTAAGALGRVKVEGTEVPFKVDLHDPDTGDLLEERLVGAFDLVVREEERLVVIEHKTSARRWSQDQLSHDIQVSGYKLAAQKLALGDVGLRYQILTKTKAPAMQVEDVQRGDRDIADFLHIVVGVLRSIDRGVFYPLRGPGCRTCPYQIPCEAGEKGA